MSERSAEILKPFGDYKTPGVQEEVVEVLKNALEQAERGEVSALGLVLLAPNKFCRTRSVQGSCGYGELVGGISILHYDAIRAWKEEG